MRISGSKGGGSGSAPTESPDSLHSVALARTLDLVSAGPIKGLVNGLQSIMLDGTPIQNSDGSTNFTNYSIDWRLGTQDQTFMPGFPAVENEVAINVPLTSDAPWVHEVENTQLTAVRIRFGLPSFQKSDATTGDVTGYHVDYAIDLAVDGGAYAQVLTGAFDGKTTSLYERSVRIELPAAATSWLVRVRRLTANAHSALIADTVNIEAITEVIDRKLRYPMSAVFAMSFDARSFSTVPVRSFELDLLIISIPSNYDPIARTYSGNWDGTFKQDWTNNPAWIFYDLVLNKLYGLGKRVDASMIDKWGLYDIARYCDVLVSDGKGGQEPRFTCNAIIQSQADAYKVLQDLATVFRGVAYWGPGEVFASADMPGDPVYTYTDANRCASGPFTYVGSARSTRYTTALVSWNDPANGYQQAVEPYVDQDGVARYGVNKAQITAFGTTSQGQAHRLGMWTCLTSRYETNTVSFTVGLDGTLCAPGQIIAIADPAKAGRRNGGRVRAATAVSVTLDRAPAVAAGDTLTVILPTGIAQKRTVQSIVGDTIAVTAAFDSAPVPGAVWMLESVDLVAQLFRVVSVQESDGEEITYTVNASQYEPGKYAAIDTGAAIQVRPITVIPPSAQVPPTNVRLSTYSVIDQGISKTVMVIAWDAAANSVQYLPEWQKDNGEWVAMNAVGGLQTEVTGIYQGSYLARVRAVNGMGVTSVPAYGVVTALTGKTSPPPSITSLTTVAQIFGIEIDWTFPGDGSAGDTQRTELWYSRTPARADAVKQSDYAYPQAKATLMGLAAGQEFFFWARLVDTSGNIGPWFPAGDPGVQGESSTDAAAYNAYFAGLITKTALGEDLLSDINAIPDLQQDVEATGAALTEETQNRVDGDSALSQRLDVVSAQVLVPPLAGSTTDYAGSTQVYAGVWSEQSARAEADQAIATNVETVTAQITNSNTTLIAAIQTETTARVDADGALATQITTVEAQADQNAADVQTVSTAQANFAGQVAASYQIKTQVSIGGHTYYAGVGIGVDNLSGIIESQVLLSASRVAILDPNGGAVTAPFVVQGGQVFISQALIGTGWITNLMIGSIIQSDNYVAGVSGWRLDKGGTFEINNSDGAGNHIVINSNGITGTRPGGGLAYQLGFF